MDHRCDQKNANYADLECEILLSFKCICVTALKLFSPQTMDVKGHAEGFGDGIKRLKHQFPMSNTM